MRWRNVWFVAVVFVCAVSSAHAQRDYEITPFFGTRVGGNIDLTTQGNPNVDFLKIKDSEDYGVLAGVTFWNNFEGEFMWNRQPTSLSSHNPNDNSYTYVSNLNLDMYHFDILYQFLSPDSKFRPFVVGGLGLSHFGGQNASAQNVLGFSNRFSFNLGGGVKYFFNSHFGIRLEARWSPTDTTQGQSQYCDYTGYCYPAIVTNKAQQGQANVGLIFRFNK